MQRHCDRNLRFGRSGRLAAAGTGGQGKRGNGDQGRGGPAEGNRHRRLIPLTASALSGHPPNDPGSPARRTFPLEVRTLRLICKGGPTDLTTSLSVTYFERTRTFFLLCFCQERSRPGRAPGSIGDRFSRPIPPVRRSQAR
ncbi:hypothetical protein MGWOODY_Smn3220 [hydrothermal vent metagenome]|uniref:Uncharacterized protein n=1 Tax=hydrothermal vent metagenome TaxID=652676 RepID=A0A160TNG1_9ZZZZ